MSSVVTNLVCPLIGTLICNVMWLSPLPAVLEARRQHSMGALNPLPFGVTVLNCIGWTGYGIMRRDYFIFFSNSSGLVLGLFYSLSALSIMYRPSMGKDERQAHSYLEALVISAFVMWLGVFLIVGIAASGMSKEQDFSNGSLVGYLGSVCGLIYYSAPLSVMRKVVETRDSGSLYAPTIVANMGNALMWVIYGWFAVHDPIVYGPNLFGLLISAVQLGLIAVYPKKEVLPTASSGEESHVKFAGAASKASKRADKGSGATRDGAIYYFDSLGRRRRFDRMPPKAEIAGTEDVLLATDEVEAIEL